MLSLELFSAQAVPYSIIFGNAYYLGICVEKILPKMLLRLLTLHIDLVRIRGCLLAVHLSVSLFSHKDIMFISNPEWKGLNHKDFILPWGGHGDKRKLAYLLTSQGGASGPFMGPTSRSPFRAATTLRMRADTDVEQWSLVGRNQCVVSCFLVLTEWKTGWYSLQSIPIIK
ncbi:MAG: hypothetical protein CSA33_06730 [Desulfobulbus propionicus]|nr:MAG: hypothetical protein CSA33_06730 [Desulfobulbus propionicus]